MGYSVTIGEASFDVHDRIPQEPPATNAVGATQSLPEFHLVVEPFDDADVVYRLYEANATGLDPVDEADNSPTKPLS